MNIMDTVSLIAEFLGTFLLVLSVLASGGNAYVIGATLAVIVLLTGKLSGAHVNPAISLTMYVKGGLSAKELGLYMASQFLGGVASLYAYRVFA
jgi:aquaporin Z